MARKLSENIQRLRDEITCPVCHDVYEDPKLLPCCHYYCKECIVQLAGKGQPFPCPECRKDTFLVQDSADRFPPASFVSYVKSVVNMIELEKCRDDSDEAVTGSLTLGAAAAILSCDQCSSPEARSVAFCRQCTHFMCEFCEQAHKRLKLYSDHTIVRIDSRIDVSDDRDVRGFSESVEICRRHTEQLKIYCFTCEELICRDCTLIDHKDHQYEFIETSVQQIKQDLQDSLVPLEEAQAKLRSAKVEVEKFKERSHDHKKALEDEIQQHCRGVLQMVEKYQKEMLDQVHSKADDNLKSLAAREKSLEMSMEELQGVVNQVRNAASSGSREEVASVNKQLQKKMKEETARINALDITPVIELCSLETCKRGIEDAIRESIKLIPLTVDPKRCAVRAETAETNVLTRFMLTTYSQNGKPFSVGSKSIKAELKSMVDVAESAVPLVVSETLTMGTYQLSCTPKVRGYHQLTIALNEQPICRPFLEFVKHPPNQLGWPIRIINNVGVPIDITINQEGHLLVSDTFPNGILHTLTKDGQRIGNGRKMSSIRSATVDRGGFFIVTHFPLFNIYHTNLLVKFDKDWKLIKKQYLSSGFYGGKVKISPDNQYYVCDTYLNIMVSRPLVSKL